MGYKYDMRNTMQMHSFCPMVTCPMMVMQSASSCMNRMVPASCHNMSTYGTSPMWSNMPNPYFYQVEMKPVPIEEIED